MSNVLDSTQSSERAKRACVDTFIGFVNAKLHPTSPKDRVIYGFIMFNWSFAEQLSSQSILMMVKNINHPLFIHLLPASAVHLIRLRS